MEKTRVVLEVLYFLSGIAVAVIAGFALKQISIAKSTLEAAKRSLATAVQALETAEDDIRVRSYREAVTLAAQQCERLAETIIPQWQNTIANLSQKKIYVQFQFPATGLNDRALLGDSNMRNMVETVNADGECRMSVFKTLNLFEGFAVYFTKGAADESVAFPSAGSVLCNVVEVLAPLLIAVRTERVSGVTSGPYQNLVDLYLLWSARFKEPMLKNAAEAISQELINLRVPELRPIGMDVQKSASATQRNKG